MNINENQQQQINEDTDNLKKENEPFPETENDLCDYKNCLSTITNTNKLSFGRGYLNENGYWQYPCRICAKSMEKKDKEDNYTEFMPYFPPENYDYKKYQKNFNKQMKKEIMKKTKRYEKYLKKQNKT